MSNLRLFGFDEAGIIRRIHHRIAYDLSPVEPVSSGDILAVKSALGLSGDLTSSSSPIDPTMVSVTSHGPDPTGTFDSTIPFANAVTATPVKGTLWVPAGTYILDGLQINKDINIRLAPGAVLKAKVGATAAMIAYTANATGFFEGGTLDGNQANQTRNTANWWPLLMTLTTRSFVVRDVNFINFTFSGLSSQIGSSGWVQVLRCNFLNGAEHGGPTTTLGLQTSGINYGVALQDARPRLSVVGCSFIQDNWPSTDFYGPGGCIVAGADSLNCYLSIEFRANYLRKIGQTTPIGNHIGGIDLYEDVAGAEIVGNKFLECQYVPMKLQNCSRLVCTDNEVYSVDARALTTTAIWFDPHQRTQVTGNNEPAIISRNIIFNRTGVSANCTGIGVEGNVGLGRKAIISENHVENGWIGITVGGEVGFQGPVLVEGNTVLGTSSLALEFKFTSGQVRVAHNHISGAVGMAALDHVDSAEFFLDSNYLEATTGGSRALIIEGAKKVYCFSGVYNNTTTGGNGVHFSQDGLANKVGELFFPADSNLLQNGCLDTTVVADITKWRHRNIKTAFTSSSSVTNSGSAETDLLNWSIPTNSYIKANTEYLEAEIGGLIVGSANSKRIRVYLGATTLFDSTSQAVASNTAYKILVKIVRIGTTSQVCTVELRTGAVIAGFATLTFTTPAENLASNVTFRVTGQGGASTEIFASYVTIKNHTP